MRRVNYVATKFNSANMLQMGWESFNFLEWRYIWYAFWGDDESSDDKSRDKYLLDSSDQEERHWMFLRNSTL